MTSYTTILLEKNENIATITLNRPDKMNACNDPMAEELLTCFETVDKDKDVRAVIITGAGKGGMCCLRYVEYELRRKMQNPGAISIKRKHLVWAQKSRI